jgi:predicted phosphoribosyltransferase
LGGGRGSGQRAKGSLTGLQTVKTQNPPEVHVAVPVASPDRLAKVRRGCNDAVCLLAPAFFGAIRQFYQDFTRVVDEVVVRLLRGFAPVALSRCLLEMSENGNQWLAGPGSA